eukprot:66760-Hanusia_phi.AAC.1
MSGEHVMQFPAFRAEGTDMSWRQDLFATMRGEEPDRREGEFNGRQQEKLSEMNVGSLARGRSFPSRWRCVATYDA